MSIDKNHPAGELRLGHLVLRPYRPADAPLVVEAIAESLPELKPFMPWAHLPQTVETQLKRIQGLLTANATGSDIQLAILRQERYLGGCGMHPRVPLNPQGTEIGYWVRSSATGQGLATLVTRILLVYAVDHLGMERVQINHNVENVASQRVIAKCGFVPEGRIRRGLPRPDPAHLADGFSACQDLLSYALLSEEVGAQPWYAEIRGQLVLVDQLGNLQGSGEKFTPGGGDGNQI